MKGERWETFRDGFTCSTNPLDADWSRVNYFSHVFETLDSDWLCDEAATMTTQISIELTSD